MLIALSFIFLVLATLVSRSHTTFSVFYFFRHHKEKREKAVWPRFQTLYLLYFYSTYVAVFEWIKTFFLATC